MSTDVTPEKLTETYLKIKSRRAELSAEFKSKDDPLAEQLEKVKAALLAYCKEQGLESVKTSAGLFYRSVKTRYWTGQDHKCTVVQLQGSNVERRVYALLDNRIDVHTKMIDLYQEILD